MILAESTEELLTWDTEKLWTQFEILMKSEDETQKPLKTKYTKEEEQIKEGIKIKIPIWYITNQWYKQYPTSGTIKVLGYPKMKLTDFMTEKEERDRIMRLIILDNFDEQLSYPRN